MAIPSQITADIQAGKEYLGKLVGDYINDINNGGCTCDTDTMHMLDDILVSLGYKQETDTYDSVTQGLYFKMMEIIGGVAYVPPVTANAIYTGVGMPDTQEEIMQGLLTPYVDGEPMLAVFNNSTVDFKYLAIPITAVEPNYYQSQTNPFDQGSIGGVSDLFGQFNIVGGFLVSYSNYPLALTDTYLLTTV